MKAVIASYARSPFHFARKGRLADVRPDTLAAQVAQGLLQRIDLDPALLEDVILGCAYPEAAQGNNLARIVGLLAGLPETVGGMTVNRFCGSSMQAVHIAAAQIEAGMGDAFVCVGVESMTMVPQGGFNFSPNPGLLTSSDAYISMGETAENVARRWNVSRADQELLALQSHLKAAGARDEGRLADEIIPIPLPGGELVDSDGCIRPATTLEALGALKPAFRPDGMVTAGTSSPLTDGAAAVLVTSDDFAQRHGLHGIGAHPQLRDRRGGPRDHGHRADPGHAQGAGPCRSHGGRSGRGRDQRSLFIAGAGLHPRPWPGHVRREYGWRWAGHRPSARCDGGAHHGQGSGPACSAARTVCPGYPMHRRRTRYCHGAGETVKSDQPRPEIQLHSRKP